MKAPYHVFSAMLLTFVGACTTLPDRWEAAKSADAIHAYKDSIRQSPDDNLAGLLCDQGDRKKAGLNTATSSHEDLLRRLPEGNFAVQALSRLESSYFQEVKETNGIAEYDEFIQRYSTGVLADDAKSRFEVSDHQKSKALGTNLTYDDFMRTLPQYRLVEEVQSHGEDMQAKRDIVLGIRRLAIKFTNYEYDMWMHQVMALGSGELPKADIIKNGLLEAVKNAFEIAGYEVAEDASITVSINYQNYYEKSPSKTDTSGAESFTAEHKQMLELALIHGEDKTLCAKHFALKHGVDVIISSDNKVSYYLNNWTKEITEKVRDSLPLESWCK